jgi:hypothetical protein
MQMNATVSLGLVIFKDIVIRVGVHTWRHSQRMSQGIAGPGAINCKPKADRRLRRRRTVMGHQRGRGQGMQPGEVSIEARTTLAAELQAKRVRGKAKEKWKRSKSRVPKSDVGGERRVFIYQRIQVRQGVLHYKTKTLIHRYLEHLKARVSPAAQPQHRVAGSVPYIAGFRNMPIHPPIHPSSSAIKTDAEPKATGRKSRLLPSSQIATAIPPYYPGPLKQPAH